MIKVVKVSARFWLMNAFFFKGLLILIQEHWNNSQLEEVSNCGLQSGPQSGKLRTEFAKDVEREVTNVVTLEHLRAGRISYC